MPPAKDPTGRVLAEIAKGTHDGNLMEIVKAISTRGADRLLWRITLDGETWDAETITIGELRYVESVTGKSYLQLDPKRSMSDFAALVVAHYWAQDMTLQEATEKAERITQPAALAALSLYEGSLGKD